MIETITALALLVASSLPVPVVPEPEAPRERLITYFAETEAYLTHAIESLNPMEWGYKARSESWSVAECATHLFLAEQRVLNTVREAVADGYTSSPDEIVEAASLPVARIIETVNDRVRLQAQSPGFLRPDSVLWETPAAFLQAFRQHRASWQSWLNQQSGPFDHLTREIPFGIGRGDLDHFQIFVVAHTSRHTQQIEEVLREQGQDIRHVAFNGRCKVNYPAGQRAAIARIFGQVLGCEIHVSGNIDRVEFGPTGSLAFVYQDDSARYLSPLEHLNGMWMQLDVPWYAYESLKSQLKANGVTPLAAFKAKETTHFYFQLPGGLTCRLVKGQPRSTGTEVSYDAELANRLAADPFGMRQYVLAWLKEGPNRNLSEAESRVLQTAHLRNIERLAAEEKLVLAGPFLDEGPVRGLYIFNVGTIEEARSLTATDPAVRAGSLEMELHPWYGSAALLELNAIHQRIAQKPPSDGTD